MRREIVTARRLRRDQTDAERTLWRRLRGRQLGAVKFRRQHPIPPIIVDFCCVERRLVIEIDGGQHATTGDRDRRRTQILQRQEYRVLRFWNTEVLQRIDAVLEEIDCAFRQAPSP